VLFRSQFAAHAAIYEIVIHIFVHGYSILHSELKIIYNSETCWIQTRLGNRLLPFFWIKYARKNQAFDFVSKANQTRRSKLPDQRFNILRNLSHLLVIFVHDEMGKTFGKN
jgi:hypothetical protein